MAIVYRINAAGLRGRELLQGPLTRGLKTIGCWDGLRGQNVLIKPNLCGPGSVPHLYSVTDPEMIVALVQTAHQAGANAVAVADQCAGYVRDSNAFFRALGISALTALAQENRFHFFDLGNLRFEKFGGFLGLGGLSLSSEIKAFPVIINTTLPKTHHQAGLSLCLKNLALGLASPEQRQAWHKSGEKLNAGIVAANKIIRKNHQVIDILDGRFGQEGLGPHFGEPIEPGFMLFGTDPVAVDAAGARQIGFTASTVSTIVQAQMSGLGSIDTEVVGDNVAPARLKPSPPWEFAPLDENKVIVYWLDEKNNGRARIYELNEAQQIYALLNQKTFVFDRPIAPPHFRRWLFEGGGYYAIDQLPGDIVQVKI